MLSASRKDVLAAQIGDDLTTYEMGMLLNQRLKFRNLGVNLSWPRHQAWPPKVYPNRPKTETWA